MQSWEGDTIRRLERDLASEVMRGQPFSTYEEEVGRE